MPGAPKKMHSVQVNGKQQALKRRDSDSILVEFESNLYKKVKSLDDDHVKTYTVDQIMKIPFFSQANKEREK